MSQGRFRRAGWRRFRTGAAGWATLGVLAVLAGPVRAQDHEAIPRAIARGVAYLKTVQLNAGPPGIGANALVGLTLLECGVPADDPAVQRFAEIVRTASPAMEYTYSVSLAIMFLDRLGDPGDVPFIQSLGVRLLAGQNATGGWSYMCPLVDNKEAQRLRTLLGQRNELRGSREAPRVPPPAARDRPKLPPEIEDQLNRLEQVRATLMEPGKVPGGDNSNTQFATLGLWVARRHGIPLERALIGVARRFHGSQNADGGWGYRLQTASTGTMTCAGLLGLAAGYGVMNEVALRTAPGTSGDKNVAVRDPGRDPAVRAALLRLAWEIGQPSAQAKALPPVIPRGFAKRIYYFFWSLERVGAAYDLPTICKKDWFAWGSEMLVASQGADGTWEGEHGPPVDTCFALLFLGRCNLARDLTASLKGRVQDPGEVALRSGGVSGQGLLGKELKPGAAPLNGPGGVAAESDLEAQAARLTTQLILAPAGQQQKLLDQFKEAKGVVYTQALAAAIPQLDRALQGPARDALAERLTRMTPATLRSRLKDEDPEMRAAAARASAAREDPALAPDIIALLEDPEPWVARAARTALKVLAGGQDFGPPDKASAAQRVEAVIAWKKWWREHPLGAKSK